MTTRRTLPLLLAAWLLSTSSLHAAQQYQGLCSLIRIEIEQELTLERIGFLATLKVTNNEGDASITNFSAGLTFDSRAWSADGSYQDASDLFFVQPPVLKNVGSIDGNGIIPPGVTAEVQWFLIPKISAGGMTPEGLAYRVGAELGAVLNGEPVPADALEVLPDTITVRPDPLLRITYFQPRDVDGDNPFTPEIVETPIPFTLGVLVENVGFGTARKLKIDSQQPRIVENEQGLLVVPRLLGSRVDDEPTDHASLLVDLGDMEPGRCRKGAWDMITTLSGEFTEFSASYTHAPELGGEATSVIQELDAFFMVREVLNDLPGRDGLLDFLAVTGEAENEPESDWNPVIIPDTLYETDCNIVPVNALLERDGVAETTAFDGVNATVHVDATVEGFVAVMLFDPAQARYPIARVVRSDGKVLSPRNAWTSLRYRKPDNAELPYLYLFDFVQLGAYDYTVTYEPDDTDVDPPVTSLLFSGEHHVSGGVHYVLPETQLFFLVNDASPVGTWRRLDGDGDFVPAYPFTIPEAGAHTLEYYSRDAHLNQEAAQTATIVVAPDDPSVADLLADTDAIHLTGGAVSVRPADATFSFTANGNGLPLTAELEVFRGVWAWPTLQGVPGSPTRATGAELVVGGENVDFYKWRLNGGAWSAEQPVGAPLQVSGLAGYASVDVLARSSRGDYLPEGEALNVVWATSPGAPEWTLTAGQPTPSRGRDATFTVAGCEEYRWTVDASYFRAEQPVSAPIELERLADGEHVVEVFGRSGGTPWPNFGNPGVETVAFPHRVDPDWGLALPLAERIRYEALGAVGPAPTASWDGRDDAGAVVSPGWYSVKLTVTDPLGRSASGIVPVRIGDLLAEAAPLDAGGAAGQDRVDVRGGWAVWQDQRSGSWDIRALDLDAAAPGSVALTGDGRNHERPRTDGVLVVWQARQANGNWDVWAADLANLGAGAYPLTATSGLDETRPVVAWPWVVWQQRATANAGEPQQLMVRNLLDGTTAAVDPTTQDQLDPGVYEDTLVWQDLRDVGYGEIYLKDLSSGSVRRLTTEPHGQYNPVVWDQWVVWADNRDTQLDLYGFNLLQGAEVRLTATPENESRPALAGRWVVYQEDSGGGANLRLLHATSRASLQVTNSTSAKALPRISGADVYWIDQDGASPRVMRGPLPDLQAAFASQNLLAVTDGVTGYVGDAFGLLRLWHAQAGVTALTRYTALAPTPVAETVTWSGGAPAGTNFPLVAGSFLWADFDGQRIVDLAEGGCGARSLSVGSNVLVSACFPDGYSAYRLVRSLGLANVNAVRTLDGESGRWVSVAVVGGELRGEDFPIDTVGVVLVDLGAEVTSWRP